MIQRKSSDPIRLRRFTLIQYHFFILAGPMPRKSARSISGSHNTFEHSLTDRVRDRVEEASRALDRGKPRGRQSSKLAQNRLGAATSPTKSDAEALREKRSLRHVYKELRGTYRKHRRDSGQAALPELKEAVQAFKRGPSLTSLVVVAAFLDERGLLAW
jgi:hypothetical protein